MEWHNVKKASVGDRLYQQVKEQSDLCDVTVQVGKWRKKFHWCVLVESPFFECIRRGDFVERSTDLVNLDVAYPFATEAAIRFLYGKRPTLKGNNVESILYMAEFLLIPNLKELCVSLLQKTRITDKNCLQIVEISSIYEFEVPNCYDYIRGHLPEILKRESAINLTRESVLTLFTDPLLSYVSAEGKLEFALRWAELSQQNKVAFNDVVDTLDLESIDVDVLKNVLNIRSPLLSEEIEYKIRKILQSDAIEQHRVVCISYRIDGKSICFDLETKRLYGIELGLPKEVTRGRSFQMLYTRGQNEICHLSNEVNGFKLCTQDLTSGQCSVSNIPLSGFKPFREKQYRQFKSIARDTLVIVDPDSSSKPPMCTTIFVGKLQHPETNVYPILTLRNVRIQDMCINERQLIALQSYTEELHIYDMVNCVLDTISPKHDFKKFRSLLEATEHGFIVYSQETVLNITRTIDTTPNNKYVIQKIDLEHELDPSIDSVTYMYDKNIWTRIVRRTEEGAVNTELVSHENLINAADTKAIPWEQLPPGITPDSVGTVFMLELPKSMLRCHYLCPHCEQHTEKQWQIRPAMSSRRDAHCIEFELNAWDVSDEDDFGYDYWY